MRTIHRNGQVQHVGTPDAELPRITDRTNVLPEIQSLVDILHRRIQDTEKAMALKEAELKSLIAQVQAGNSAAIHGVVEELANREAAHTAAIVLLRARIIAAESVTLWSLVRRCFAR